MFNEVIGNTSVLTVLNTRRKNERGLYPIKIQAENDSLNHNSDEHKPDIRLKIQDDFAKKSKAIRMYESKSGRYMGRKR